MRVLLCNNFVRGVSGTDAGVLIEEQGLRDLGHEVTLLRRDNSEFGAAGPVRKLTLAASTAYSFSTRRRVGALLDGGRFDIVHVNNVVPLITGSIYDACRGRVPTVATLHNFRAICPSSYLFREGRPCQACLRWAALPAVVHGCYRGSRVQSAGLVAARWIDRARGRPLGHAADHYFAVSEHMRRRHAEWGIDPKDVTVVHNPAEDLGSTAKGFACGRSGRFLGEGSTDSGAQPRIMTYVGALLEAKGVGSLIDLAAALPEFTFRLIGSGADRQSLARRMERLRLGNVELCGFLAGADRVPVWAGSFVTLVPSRWEEPFGVVVPESYSLGVPVVATGRGGLAELIDDGRTGLIDDFADPVGLAARLRALWHDRSRYWAMSRAARARYEQAFAPKVFARNVEQGLMHVLEKWPPASRD